MRHKVAIAVLNHAWALPHILLTFMCLLITLCFPAMTRSTFRVGITLNDIQHGQQVRQLAADSLLSKLPWLTDYSTKEYLLNRCCRYAFFLIRYWPVECRRRSSDS